VKVQKRLSSLSMILGFQKKKFGRISQKIGNESIPKM
jgi:hypothetical protein